MRNSFTPNLNTSVKQSFISKVFRKIQVLIFRKRAKRLGAVLYLDAREADGFAPLTGNESPWVDLANEVGKNIVNKLLFVDNSYVDPVSGLFFTFGTLFRSDYVVVSGLSRVYYSTGQNSTSTGVAFYDENKVFISGITSSDINTNGWVDIPSNVIYAVFSFYKVAWTFDNAIVSKTTDVTYEPYARNDGKLVNFEGTESSGWNNVTNFEINNVINPYFLDSANDWVAIGATESVTDQVYSFIGDGTNTAPRTINIKSTPSIQDDKWFLFSKQKLDNGDCTKVGIYVRTTTSPDIPVNTVDNPLQNQYYETYDIYTMPAGETSMERVTIYAFYPDSATANGKTLEIEGKQSNDGGVLAIHLTQLDAFFGTDWANKTKEEVNAAKYDLLALQKFADVLTFDGIDDHVIFADNPSLDITEGPLVLSATFKTSDPDGFYLISRNGGGGSVDQQYALLDLGNQTISILLDGTNVKAVPYEIDKHQNVVFYWTGQEVRAFLNIVEEGVAVSYSGTLTSKDFTTLGARYNGVNYIFFLNGLLDTTLIYTGPNVDIDKILKLEQDISKQYLDMNP